MRLGGAESSWAPCTSQQGLDPTFLASPEGWKDSGMCPLPGGHAQVETCPKQHWEQEQKVFQCSDV